MSEEALVPVEQKEVLFYEDTIVAVRVADGTVYVPVRPLCELLGVSWTDQRRRINRDAVLSQEMHSVNVMFTEPNRTRQISMLCLPIALLLTKSSGSNQFGSVYGELYRKFGITSYKLLPAHRFEEAMHFLTSWYGDLTGETPF